MRRVLSLVAVGAGVVACDPCFGTFICTNSPAVSAAGEFIAHPTGTSVAGVQVTFVRVSGAQLVDDTIFATSDGSGFFSLRGEARSEGAMIGDLTIAPPLPYPTYTVSNVRLRATRTRGDGTVLGRLVVDPFMLMVGEVQDSVTRQIVTGATVTARRVSGASISADSFTVTTDSFGRFFVPATVVTFGTWVADFTISRPGSGRTWVIRQGHDTQFRDGEYRFVLLLLGP